MISVQVKAHKYFLAATSDTFKSLFFGHQESQSCQEAEEVLDYCENKSDGSDDKITMRSNEPVEVKKAVSQQICDRGEGGDDLKQTGLEQINVVCSSVGAFQVTFFPASCLLFQCVF